MKKIYSFLFVLLAHYQMFSQQFSIHLLPRYSSGATLAPTYDLVSGQRFLTPQIESKYSGTLVNSSGIQEPYDIRNDGFGLDVMFKLTNENNGNAWGGIFGFYRQNHIQRASIPTFNFKGYSLFEFITVYRQTGIQAGLRREFGMNNSALGWYIQMSALYSLQIDGKGETDNWVSLKTESKNYLENGSGVVYNNTNPQTNVLSISPEIGVLLKGKIGLELSLSYQQTTNPFSVETVSYFQNRANLGVETRDISLKSFWLNARIPIRVYTRKKSVPVYRPEPPQRQPDPVQVPSRRLQNVCVTVRDKTTQKAVGGAKILYEGKVYYTDRDGKTQLSDLRIGQKGGFNIQAQNYRGGNIDFETIDGNNCQILDINLTPLPSPPSVIINGKVMKKGESIALNNIQFEQSKSDLLPSGKTELNMVIELMKKYPTLTIEFSGHTSAFKEDTKEDYDANVELSQDRAAACKEFIIRQVRDSENRIKTIGYGPDKPLVPNVSDENRRKNRRVELKIESL